MTRAQANLVALGVALALVAAAAALSLTVAAGAFAGTDGEPLERRTAAHLADRLVSPAGPVAEAPNTLDGGALEHLDGATLAAVLPPRATGATVRLNGTTVASTGRSGGGTTVRRLVLIDRGTASRRVVTVGTGGSAVDLDRPTHRIDVNLTASDGVTAVAVGDRTVRLNESGLHGNLTLAPRSDRPVTVTLYGEESATVALTTYPRRTYPATLEVTVGA